MFESICLRHQSERGPAIDLGFLAEAMLFYQRVIVIANEGMLRELIRGCRPLVLLEMLEEGEIELRFLEEQLGVKTEHTATANEVHEFVRFSSPQHTLEIATRKHFVEAAPRSSQTRLVAPRFTRLVKMQIYDEGVTREALEQIIDFDFIEAYIRLLLQRLAPGYSPPKNLVFRISPEGTKLHVETNINFSELNAIYHQHVPKEHSTLTPAYLLTFLQEIRGELFFAATLSAEIATSPLNAEIIQLKLQKLLEARLKSEEKISLFQKMIFEDARAIREAINTGRISINEFRTVLKRARRFKQWLAEHPPDADLLHEYYQAVIADSIIDKLPVKAVRWMIFTGIGLGIDVLGGSGFGTVAGLGLNAADTFLIDKILRGWKPHQFVEDELRKVIKRN